VEHQVLLDHQEPLELQEQVVLVVLRVHQVHQEQVDLLGHQELRERQVPMVLLEQVVVPVHQVLPALAEIDI
jgi:hypothetical protein